MKRIRAPKIDVKAIAKVANEIAMDRFYKGVRKSTLEHNMKSGINTGKKSFYGGWDKDIIGPYTSVITNETQQAKAFQAGLSTVAIQVIRHVKKHNENHYVGWRTSKDPPGKKNNSLTKWVEKYRSDATEINEDGKAKTFHISIPWNKFHVKDKAVTQIVLGYSKIIRKRIARGISDELRNNKNKYIK